MLIAERQTRLQELLAQRGMADLDSLALQLNVSQSTVRRDIEQLEQLGLARRTHGGAIWVGDRTTSGIRPYAFDARMSYQIEDKRRIAKAAKALVQPGQTILLDGGTTTFYLAQQLVGMQMQLITNSLPIANLFLNEDNVELILTGGVMYPRYGVLLGPSAEQLLAGIHTQTTFLSAAGICEGWLYNQNMLLVQAEIKMIECSQRVVLLADSGKFGQQALVKLCELKEIDTVVCDAALAESHRKEIRDAGCELLIAED